MGGREPRFSLGESGKASHEKLSFVWKVEKMGTACAKAQGHKRNGMFGE